MQSDVTSTGDGRWYPDDPMRVDESATPDGRLLLYFAFGRPDAEPPVAMPPGAAGVAPDDHPAGEQG